MLLQGPQVWLPLHRPDLGFLNTLSDVFASMERRHPGIFPYLRKADRLFVASDYGGEHATAAYQTISFLVADIADCGAWQVAREAVRSQFLSDGRRMAFKSLNDRVRRKALGPFLETVNRLPGLLATFVMARSVESFFADTGRIDPADLELEGLRDLSPAVAEKLLRIVHLLSVLIAGLSAPGQDLLWATDEDAIAANAVRVQHLVEAFARVSSYCLPHDLRHFRLATPKQDKGDLSLEDLIAIPDLAAGGLSTAFQAMLGDRGAPLAGFYLPRTSAVIRKARDVLDWISDNTQPLRRVVVMIDEEPTSHKIRATSFRFQGSQDSAFE